MKSYPSLIAALLISVFAFCIGTRVHAACGEPSGCPTPEPPKPEPKPARPVPDQKPVTGSRFAVRRDAIAPSGNSQYVFVGSPSEIEKTTIALTRLGAVVLHRKDLGSLGTSLLVIDPNGLKVDTMRSALAKQNARVTIDRNSIYETAGAADNYAARLVGLKKNSGESGCPLSQRVVVGLIDGPIDRQSRSLQGVNMRVRSFLPEGDVPGDSAHATDLAVLIAGQSDRHSGLAAGASLISAVAFAHGSDGDIAQMDSVAEALDWLTGEDADIINMSLAGPKNDSLAYVLELVARAGPVLVAATGNDGAQTVSYPAADSNVIAITAVDIAKRLYRHANRGAEVDFAAPGVDLLVDDGTGPRHLSGTSYAAAVGTAVVAHLLARGAKGSAEVEAQLQSNAEDLGPVGRDISFGWGLMHVIGCRIN